MLSAMRALERLQQGNHRFVSGSQSLDPLASEMRRRELVAAQQPFAVVLGCSDSRVPVEMIFDQGLGDLFVVRVAGNIAASSQVGSIEYAAEQCGTRLVVVLGHTRCGAVQATLDELQEPAEKLSRHLYSIINSVRPVVEGLLETELKSDPDALAQRAVRANVSAAANILRQESEILNRLIQDDQLLVVGAEYALETGVVDFFDGLPTSE